MAQLVRTTNDLINSALFLISELGVGETPDAFMLVTGLEILNEIIDSWTAAKIYIPYVTTLSFNLTTGKQVYSISDMTGVTPDITANRIVNLDYVNIFVAAASAPSVILSLNIITDTQFYGLNRLSTLTARPTYVLLENKPLISTLTFYPIPDQNYPCQVRAKSMLSYMTQGQDLTNLPPYAYGFLKYALAREFMAYYPSQNWTAQHEQKYQEYYDSFLSANPIDMTIRPSDILASRNYWGWNNGQVIW